MKEFINTVKEEILMTKDGYGATRNFIFKCKFIIFLYPHIKMPCNSLSDTDNKNKIKVKELIGIGEPRILQNRPKKTNVKVNRNYCRFI